MIFDKFIDDPRRHDDDGARELGQIAAWSGRGNYRDIDWEREEFDDAVAVLRTNASLIASPTQSVRESEG